MTIKATIRNDAPAGDTARLAVTVVTVGEVDVDERRQLLAPGESATVAIERGQFVQLDDKEI